MKPIPYEVIEKAVSGDTATLFTVQQHCRSVQCIFRHALSKGDTDLQDLLNAKLLEAVFKFCFDYQPPSK